MDLLIGIDLGTTKVKCGVFNTDGKLLSFSSEGYEIYLDESKKEAMADPLIWYDAVRKVLKRSLDGLRYNKISGISVGSHGPSLVMIDEKGFPVFDSMIWLDRRAVKESKILSDRTGLHIDPSWNIPKAMWIKKNKPDFYKKVKWFCQPLDYVCYKLTGSITLSVCSDQIDAWRNEEIYSSGIDEKLFPVKVKMGEFICEVSKKVSFETAVPQGTPVYAGTGGADFVEALIGTDSLSFCKVCDRAGTSQGINVCAKVKEKIKGFFCVDHPLLKDYHHIGGMISTTGKSLEWFKNGFCYNNMSYCDAVKEASFSPLGAKGLFFLPHLSGSRTPWWDSYSKGVYFGINLNQDKRDFLRALLEGIAYEMKLILDICRDHGIRAEKIISCGAQAKNDPWNQIKANVIGLPVMIPEIIEAETLGMAIIAGYGAGVFKSIPKASKELVKIKKVFKPQKADNKKYNELFKIYQKLYPSLKDLFKLSEFV